MNGKCELCEERDLEYNADGTYKPNSFTAEELRKAIESGLKVNEQWVFKGFANYHLCPTCYAEVKRRLGGGGCFIATACYGAFEHPSVQEFRWFRDTRLNQHTWGRGLVDVYYRCSPPVARFLRSSPVAAAVVRKFLLAPILHVLRFVHGRMKS